MVQFALTSVAKPLFLILLASLPLTEASPSPISVTLPNYGSQPKTPKRGAVASETDVCSKIGTQLLLDSGNAADAIVGTIFCVGTIGMYHSGIGGGGFGLIRSPKGKYEFVDFRETAPAAAFEDMYKNNEPASRLGGLAR